MSDTMWEQSLDEIFENRVREHDNYLSVIAHYQYKLKHDWFNPQMVDAIMQTPLDFDLPSVAGFAEVWSSLYEGDILVAAIEVGEGPSRDVQVDQNRKKLSRVEMKPLCRIAKNGKAEQQKIKIRTNVTCGSNYHGDGLIAWDGSICFESTGPGNRKPKYVKDGCFCLEIGYTKVARTIGHLYEDGCVARWPYYSDVIWLFLDVNAWQNPAVRPSQL